MLPSRMLSTSPVCRAQSFGRPSFTKTSPGVYAAYACGLPLRRLHESLRPESHHLPLPPPSTHKDAFVGTTVSKIQDFAREDAPANYVCADV